MSPSILDRISFSARAVSVHCTGLARTVTKKIVLVEF